MYEFLCYKRHTCVKQQEICWVSLNIFKWKDFTWISLESTKKIAAWYEVSGMTSGNIIFKTCLGSRQWV